MHCDTTATARPETSLRSLPDDTLLGRLLDLVRDSRRIEADLVAHIAEVDARRLYRREACPSMFVYCTGTLHLSEHEAYRRIAAARASRDHPILLAMLGDGRMHLSGIALLAPLLTVENRDAVLARAVFKSKREIEELVAALAPRPDVEAVVRKLPERRPVGLLAPPDGFLPPAVVGRPADVPLPAARPEAVPEALPAADHSGPAAGRGQTLRADAGQPLVPSPAQPLRTTRATVEPLSPGRYKVQFTADAELRDKLERLRNLMRVTVPDGDLAELIAIAVTEKLQRLEARRFAMTKGAGRQVGRGSEGHQADRDMTSSRHIPARVRRAVWARDGGQCRFTDADGRRCTARDWLEFHHRHPFGHGGCHKPANIALMCRAHNAYLAEIDYGIAGTTRPRGPTPCGYPTRSGTSCATVPAASGRL